MKTAAGALVRVTSVMIAVAGIGFAQDMTVEWKATVSDLERRLPALPAEGTAVDEWRSDAEALRS